MMNSKWAPGPGGGPKYYSGSGPITFDEFDLNGYRSCSVTMPDNQMAVDGYDPLIDIENKNTVQFAMTIRTIDLSKCMYVVEFFDDKGQSMGESKKNVTGKIDYQFKDVFETFKVPRGAKYAKVSWVFLNKVTACTYLNPRFYAM